MVMVPDCSHVTGPRDIGRSSSATLIREARHGRKKAYCEGDVRALEGNSAY